MSDRTTRDLSEFSDPLENYDPKSYDDPTERALAEEPVAAIQSTPFTVIAPETPVEDAIAQLAGLEVACLLVAKDEQLVGIFGDRDALDWVALEYDDVRGRPVSEFMTRDAVYVYDTDSSAAVLNVMAVSGFRHVPVLDSDGAIVGIVSPQRVTGFLQQSIDAG